MDDEASIRAMVYISFWLLFVVMTTRSFQKDWVSVRRRLKGAIYFYIFPHLFPADGTLVAIDPLEIAISAKRFYAKVGPR